MISIVDYGAGNIRSVQNMLRAIGAQSEIVGDAEGVAKAERLILPGVGHFDHGMAGLEARGLIPALNRRVLEDAVPVLGICLGAQLMTRGSEEGKRRGLGWIDADTVAFDRSRIDGPRQVPHMGWAETWVSPGGRESGALSEIFAGAIPDDARYYYVHSFHLDCDDPGRVILRARHGYEFSAAFAHANVLGVQFHPEKSHRFGKALVEAFTSWDPKARRKRAT